jgi:thiamine-phosphate pyrophosphorylase
LRFLEDVARFLLNDATLSQQLKAIRHSLAEDAKALHVKPLSQRNSEHDVGHPHTVPLPSSDRGMNVESASPQDLPGLITANAKRVEESLRVIEELAKLPEMISILDSAKFELARFALYTLERELVSRILRQDKVKRLAGLYVILDRQALAGRNELDIADQIIRGGARILQFRDKQGSKGELLLIAQRLKDLCSKAGVLFIMNDYLDVALAVDADGLHVGQGDLPLPIIRRELPIGKIVGCSVTTLAQAVAAQNDGVDYISVGSIFPTATKEEATVVGLDTLKEVKQAVSSPVVAIGGINEDNVDQAIAAGADAIAVINAVLGGEDVREAVQRLISKMDLAKEKCQNR